MGLGKGKSEHSGARDKGRKDGHGGDTHEAKDWASRARRRDEDDDLRRELDAAREQREADPTPE
jgi:hypothetical protein